MSQTPAAMEDEFVGGPPSILSRFSEKAMTAAVAPHGAEPEAGGPGVVTSIAKFSNDAAASVDDRIARLQTQGEDAGLTEYIAFVQARLKVNRTQTEALKALYDEQVRHVQGVFLDGEPAIQCWDVEDAQVTAQQMEYIREECSILHDHVGEKLTIVEKELGELQYIVRHRHECLASLESDEAGHIMRTRVHFAQRFIKMARAMETEIDNLRSALSAGLSDVRGQIQALADEARF